MDDEQKNKQAGVMYLAKGTFAYCSMEVEVVKVDLTVEVNGLRETATHTPHGSSLRKEETKQGIKDGSGEQEGQLLDSWRCPAKGK